MTTFITVLQFLFAIVLIVTVLLQPGKSAGISGAIGGGADEIFGKSKAIDTFLSKISTIAAILFLILTLVLYIIG